MRMYDIISKKKNGQALNEKEIRYFIEEYTKGSIPDYQAAALLMAICLRGMNDAETLALTDAMANSGDVIDLSEFGELSADKHSTGGVGDKTSLIVAPIVAALGGKITKMSGRGLGHTGGTVDKLESIPGYRVDISRQEFLKQARDVGIVIAGQSGKLTPADKKLYALRDVTATVDSVPLIASSIMSKKLASGSHCIVLDVKVGSGAFMKTASDAKILAEKMVNIGKGSGRKTTALITNMDSPLGNAIGNSLEVVEAVEVLKGGGPEDLKEICIALASNMVSLIFGVPEEEARLRVLDAVSSGAAYHKMREWIAAQGGDVCYIDDTSLLAKAKYCVPVKSKMSGYITAMNCEAIGNAAVILGAGRCSKDDSIDHSAGIIIHAKTGDSIEKGDVLCTLYTNDETAALQAERRYLSAISIGEKAPQKSPLIFDAKK